MPGNALAIPGVEFTRTGLKFDGQVSFDVWLEAGTALATVEQGIHWMIGDWLLYGDGRKAEWGAMYAEAMERFPFEYQTLRHDKKLAQAFQLCRRRHKLSWTHHDVVAALPPVEQDRWLNRAGRPGQAGIGRDGWRRVRGRPVDSSPVGVSGSSSEYRNRISKPVCLGRRGARLRGPTPADRRRRAPCRGDQQAVEGHHAG